MKKMKVRYIFGIIAVVGLLLSVSACSDNADDKLEAVTVNKFLEVYAGGNAASTIDFAAISSSASIEVKSNLKWEVSLTECEGGWCKVDVANHRGNGSFNINVEKNGLQTRECLVTVYSIGYPSMEKTEIRIIQQPVSAEEALPVVEKPSLANEVGQTSASIEFSYSSPYYAVVGYGIQYNKESEQDWKEISGNSSNGKVTGTLTGLSEGTVYKVRGYVEYEVDGNRKTQYSSDELTFTTEGETPGGGDNPPPPVP